MPIKAEDNEILDLLAKTDNDRILFSLINSTTEISLIQGISAAGANTDITLLTPTLDSEIISTGRCLSLDVPPMTPDGIPTPALITRSSLSNIPIETLIIDAGFSVYPKVPFFYTGVGTSRNPAKEPALPDFDKVFKAGRHIANTVFRHYSVIALGESIPGGTTTAFLMLRALGYDTPTSSSLPQDPSDLKETLWKAVKARTDVIKLDVEKRIAEVGDYTMAMALGILSGVGEKPVLLFGGTQMATVYRLSELMGQKSNKYLCTTNWVYRHRKETIDMLVECPEKIIISNMSFKNSRHEGLRRYDDGHVREGAGMGGSFMLGTIKIDEASIYLQTDRFYDTFL